MAVVREGAAGEAAVEGTSRLAWLALTRTSPPGAAGAGAGAAGAEAGDLVAAVEAAGLGVEAGRVAAPDDAQMHQGRQRFCPV